MRSSMLATGAISWCLVKRAACDRRCSSQYDVRHTRQDRAAAGRSSPRHTSHSTSSATQGVKEVLCDVCLGEERPAAARSCLVCLTSYCEEHLRSHAARFTKHQLMAPVANMEERMCAKHQRLLELFCKKEQACVCVLCSETDHRAHYTVPVEREWTDKKVSAAREVEESAAVCAELLRAVQRAQAELRRDAEERRARAERRAAGLVAELQQEVAELQRRSADLEMLGRTDHIHFLQSFPAFSASPSVKDWSGTSVATDTSIKKVLKYTADLTLDPDTANPWLQLSQDRRQVRHLGAWQDLPDNPRRFDTVVIVLGREPLAAGRHYWEVAVGHKDDWYLGVAKSSVNRKGRISVSTAHGYWALAMKKGGEYRASTAPPSLLTLDPRPKRVGVYVDCEEGQ
ncbi:hypothetical protein CRUP_013784, partial [Coryphaenoides rupestris]